MTVELYSQPVLSITKRLDTRFKQWTPEIAETVERLIDEIIILADHDCLDLLRSRNVEQEVLNILDET